ncbi:MAG: hypothetical protein ABIO70_34675 [Pseudomonadota bacterium]
MNARLLLLSLPLTALALVGCPEEKETDDTGTPTDTSDTSTEDTDTSDDCVPITWTDGNSGVYTVNSAGDDHLKHHFRMPEGAARLVLTTTWDTDWNMKATAGTGTCPHSGTAYADDYNATGSITLELLPGDVVEGAETFTADQQWFNHIEVYMVADPPEDGATANYTMEGMTCPPAE